jgi:transposase InsO family protein
MPWKELFTMEIREEFVLRATSPNANIAALCREFGVSRKTGYKWLERFEELGVVGLDDMSRRPKESPLAVSGDVVAELTTIRVAHPTWGSKKLIEVAKRRLPADEVPSRSTVDRILKRAGLVQGGRRRRHPAEDGKPPQKASSVEVKAPNDLWTVDFKGWWLAMDKTRCEPLTVRDAFSRYVIAIEVLPTSSGEAVLEVFENVFSRYGLPKAIQTDNGPPFVASHGVLGLTKLSAWWLSLGIEHVRSRPRTPSDNGDDRVKARRNDRARRDRAGACSLDVGVYAA